MSKQSGAAPAAAAKAGVVGFLRHQIKHRPSLIPLFLIMGTAVTGAGLYLLRLALICPEVSCNYFMGSLAFCKAEAWLVRQLRLYLVQEDLATVTHTLITKRWDRKNNPEPWNQLEPTHRYKFFAINMDYNKLEKDRPDF